MKAEGLSGIAARMLDLRYVGQGYELAVNASGNFVEEFHREHEVRYGYSDRERPVEVVNARVRMIAKAEEIRLPRFEVQTGDGRQAVLGPKRIFYDGTWCKGTLYDRALLRAGDTFCGPAIVTEYSATTFVPPATEVGVDEFLNLVIQISD